MLKIVRLGVGFGSDDIELKSLADFVQHAHYERYFTSLTRMVFEKQAEK